MNDQRLDSILVSISDEWNVAEKAIKTAENIDQEVVIPSIFELRYAGRRIVDALLMHRKDNDAALALLNDAKFNCHRARHDAIDAATTKMTGDLTAALETLGPGPIMLYFKDFPEYLASLQLARSKIAISREDRENRDAIYETIQSTDLVRLSDLYAQFKASEPLIIAAAEKNALELQESKASALEAQMEAERSKALAKRESRKANWGLGIGVLGLVLAVVAFFV